MNFSHESILFTSGKKLKNNFLYQVLNLNFKKSNCNAEDFDWMMLFFVQTLKIPIKKSFKQKILK